MAAPLFPSSSLFKILSYYPPPFHIFSKGIISPAKITKKDEKSQKRTCPCFVFCQTYTHCCSFRHFLLASLSVNCFIICFVCLFSPREPLSFTWTFFSFANGWLWNGPKALFSDMSWVVICFYTTHCSCRLSLPLNEKDGPQNTMLRNKGWMFEICY